MSLFINIDLKLIHNLVSILIVLYPQAIVYYHLSSYYIYCKCIWDRDVTLNFHLSQGEVKVKMGPVVFYRLICFLVFWFLLWLFDVSVLGFGSERGWFLLLCFQLDLFLFEVCEVVFLLQHEVPGIYELGWVFGVQIAEVWKEAGVELFAGGELISTSEQWVQQNEVTWVYVMLV